MRHFLLLTALLVGIFSIYNARASEPMLTLTTKSFQNAATLPVIYTCDGKDISPNLSWTNIPTKAQSFALILSDPDAPGGTFYHWALFNIPITANQLEQGTISLPIGTSIGTNSFGKMQYNGPCPPKGSTHHYIFTLYALDTKLILAKGANINSILNALYNHIIEQAELTAKFGH